MKSAQMDRIGGRVPSALFVRAAAGAFLLILAFGWLWWRTVSHAPLMTVSAIQVPRNNSYTLYAKASRVLSGTQDVGRATATRRTGLSQLRSLQDLVEANRPALILVHEGLHLDYVQPPARSAIQSTSLYEFGMLARLLAIETGMQTERQDWNGAANVQLDQLAFSESLLRGGGVESVPIALSFRRFRAIHSQEPFDKLNAVQLRAAISRLQAIIAHRPAFADILVEERALQLTVRDELLSDPNWRNSLSNSGAPTNTPQARVAQLGAQARLMMIDKRHVMLDYAQYIDSCIKLARTTPGMIPAYGQPPSDSINQVLAADVSGAHTTLATVSAEDAHLLARLALRCYLLEHGEYPPTLKALSRAVIDQLPGDPFGGGTVLTYRRTGKSYQLTEPVIRNAQPQPGSNYPWATRHGQF